MISDLWKTAVHSDGTFARLARRLGGYGKRHDGGPDVAAHQDRIAALQIVYRQAVAEETRIAFAHQSDSYYTSFQGHNIGKDEMTAVIYAEKIDLAASPAELSDPRLYAERLVRDLDEIKNNYRLSEDDPDGFGIGTLHSLSAKISPLIEALRQ